MSQVDRGWPVINAAVNYTPPPRQLQPGFKRRPIANLDAREAAADESRDLDVTRDGENLVTEW